jgi:cytochrome c biogenesis protein ResB
MFSALLSFLGGSVFRMIWGELSSWLNKKQDHEHEIERLRLQADIDANQHARNIEAIRVQSELGIKTIQVQAEAAIGKVEADGWLEAVKGTTQTIGIYFIDAWNGIIRPLVATWAVLMLTLHFAQNGWVLDDNGWSICGAALGIYLADRALFKRGK